jgi:thymidine phosphorylase
MGVRTTALLTDMNQPLGRMAGNLLEVHEAIWTLEGRGPADLWDCTRELGAELLVLTHQASDHDAARRTLDLHIASGRAIAKFREMVAAQGGRLHDLPAIGERHELTLGRAGHVLSINTEQLGLVIIELGGGRKLVTDSIDHAVGLEILVRIGDYIDAGRPAVYVFATREKFEQVRERIAAAFTLSDQPVAPLPLIVDRIT